MAYVDQLGTQSKINLTSILQLNFTYQCVL